VGEQRRRRRGCRQSVRLASADRLLLVMVSVLLYSLLLRLCCDS
jgi:hypothetical protein